MRWFLLAKLALVTAWLGHLLSLPERSVLTPWLIADLCLLVGLYSWVLWVDVTSPP